MLLQRFFLQISVVVVYTADLSLQLN